MTMIFINTIPLKSNQSTHQTNQPTNQSINQPIKKGTEWL